MTPTLSSSAMHRTTGARGGALLEYDLSRSPRSMLSNGIEWRVASRTPMRERSCCPDRSRRILAPQEAAPGAGNGGISTRARG
jgi:hypothetical protein